MFGLCGVRTAALVGLWGWISETELHVQNNVSLLTVNVTGLAWARRAGTLRTAGARGHSQPAQSHWCYTTERERERERDDVSSTYSSQVTSNIKYKTLKHSLNCPPAGRGFKDFQIQL